VVGLKPRHATLRLVRPDEAQPERPADQSAA
jgi:hypothetical protein